MMKVEKCKCGYGNIRKFCWNCEREQEGDYFKCGFCGEKTLEGYESSKDMSMCALCSGEVK